MKAAGVTRPLALFAGTVLGLALLVATADGAIRIAFTQDAIKARVAEAVRRTPEAIRFDRRAAGPGRVLLSLNPV